MSSQRFDTVIRAEAERPSFQKDWDRQRNRADFTRDASSAAEDLAGRLREPLLTLEAVHGLVKLKALPTREEFARATSGFLAEDSPLLALGLSALWLRQRRARRD